MRINQVTLCLLLGTMTLFGQSIKKGDLIVNANYGYPNVASKYIEFLINRDDVPPQTKTSIANKNFTYSFRVDFAISKAWTLGLSMSYWDMDYNYKSDFIWASPGGSRVSYISDRKYHLSSFGYGLRANYCFLVRKKLVCFGGLALGATNRKLEVQDYLTSALVSDGDAYRYVHFYPGTGIYFAATSGIKYFPMPYIGLNLELGYDHGALLLGGITARINTKKKVSVKNENN